MPRILIAEDDEPVRALVARALVEDGHDVVTAPDGAAALETLGRENGRFDVLLTDIKMPLMDGIALALATARDHPDITILLMTGYADSQSATIPAALTIGPQISSSRFTAWAKSSGVPPSAIMPSSVSMALPAALRPQASTIAAMRGATSAGMPAGPTAPYQTVAW